MEITTQDLELVNKIYAIRDAEAESDRHFDSCPPDDINHPAWKVQGELNQKAGILIHEAAEWIHNRYDGITWNASYEYLETFLLPHLST